MKQARTELTAAEEALSSVSLESTVDAAAILKVVRTNLKRFGELEDGKR